MTPTESAAFTRAVYPEELGRVVLAAANDWNAERYGVKRPIEWDDLTDSDRDRYSRTGAAVLRFIVGVLAGFYPVVPVKLHDPDRDGEDDTGDGPVGIVTAWGPVDSPDAA